MDEILFTSFILSIINIISNIALHYKLKHCHSLCCSSDCANSNNNSPITQEPKKPLIKQNL